MTDSDWAAWERQFSPDWLSFSDADLLRLQAKLIRLQELHAQARRLAEFERQWHEAKRPDDDAA